MELPAACSSSAPTWGSVVCRLARNRVHTSERGFPGIVLAREAGGTHIASRPLPCVCSTTHTSTHRKVLFVLQGHDVHALDLPWSARVWGLVGVHEGIKMGAVPHADALANLDGQVKVQH